MEISNVAVTDNLGFQFRLEVERYLLIAVLRVLYTENTGNDYIKYLWIELT